MNNPKYIKPNLFLFLITITFISNTLLAQISDSTITGKTHSLGEVIVTATRSEYAKDDIPQKVEVISKKEIESTHAIEITDLLKKQAGVDVIQHPGLLSGVGIRGFRPQYAGINQRTLILIDGRTAGATNLSLIDLNSIQRVEILKGPASALYGSQAMGGVINIITKKSRGETSGRVFTSLGSYNMLEGGISLGGSLFKGLDFDLNFSSFRQGKDYKLGKDNLFRNAFGFDQATRIQRVSETRDSVFKINDARGDGIRRKFSNYGKYAGSLRLGYQLSKDWRVDVRGERFQAKDVNSPNDIEIINSSPNKKDADRYSSDVLVTGNLSKKNTLTLKGFYADEDNILYRVSTNDTTNIYSSYKSYNAHTSWQGFQLQDHQSIGAHRITLGIDYNFTKEEATSFDQTGKSSPIYALYPNSELRTVGIYSQGIISLLEDRANVTLGARFESIKNNIIGTEDFSGRSETSNILNPSIGLSFKATENLRLRSTYGKGFTTVSAFSIAGYYESPTYDDPNSVEIWKGNKDLKNQSSKTFDIGAEFSDYSKGVQLEATWFLTKLSNNITNVAVPGNPGQVTASGKTVRTVYTYQNTESTDLSGIEAGISYDLGSLSNYQYSLKAFANAVWILKAKEVRDVYLVGKITLDMHNVANLNINYGIEYDNLKKISVRLSGRYVGHRYDTDWSYFFATNDYTDIKYPAFMTLDFASTFKITTNHHISLLVNNLTDENYYEKRGYNLAGRNGMIRYTFNF